MQPCTETKDADIYQRPVALLSTAELREALPELASIFKKTWVYGYWMKNKYMRRLAEMRKLNWKKKAESVSFKIMDEIVLSTGVFFSFHAAIYRGQSAGIIGFATDDERRRLDRNEFSDRAMDKVRRKIGLPDGTKPRWYELSGEEYDPNEDLESEDEEFPEDPEDVLRCKAISRPSIPDNMTVAEMLELI
ncbi:uncharacterized protein FOMMEDRAFT_22852 [Fomitiporia mediterranea MF3/22]|uniref:uncharacterized protein n=1 Tax=Fomitiporia mediterranea (strain MF3/22) TaxID=694068 RepID=UPI000440917E|nr:uncharacterized protein FOMMEDRAFT_22852 [Fomitiporia mediterranea MF3/22]EJC99771.1 hypothetical protein FOMMEDRAFT_22852 [Fomitiporia mediterranea MF3/22]